MDEQNVNNMMQGQDLNRPRLKKVKRPIRRIVPQSPSMSETVVTNSASFILDLLEHPESMRTNAAQRNI